MAGLVKPAGGSSAAGCPATPRPSRATDLIDPSTRPRPISPPPRRAVPLWPTRQAAGGARRTAVLEWPGRESSPTSRRGALRGQQHTHRRGRGWPAGTVLMPTRSPALGPPRTARAATCCGRAERGAPWCSTTMPGGGGLRRELHLRDGYGDSPVACSLHSVTPSCVWPVSICAFALRTYMRHHISSRALAPRIDCGIVPVVAGWRLGVTEQIWKGWVATRRVDYFTWHL